jgi:hypothetical protein
MSPDPATLSCQRIPVETATVSSTDAGRSQPAADGLGGVISTVCAKFPTSPRIEVETLVLAAYRHLEAAATVTSHLIPLTLNRSLRLMRESAEDHLPSVLTAGWSAPDYLPAG